MDAYARREGDALTHRQTLVIVLGVLLPTFMGSLDQTILATALPTIGRDFDDLHSVPWLITAYLLASTAIIPLYGKIADIHGRRFTLRIAIATYMAGSLACALAPNMLLLIFGRVLHGLGGGGLSSMGMIVLGDLVSPKERGRYYGYFAVTYTTAGGCGPLLGGLIAEHLHWSVIFWINIPMGLAALAIATSLLRRLPRHERPHRLDISGVALMVIASVAFMLALNLAGVRYAWTSPPILGLFALTLIVGALLAGREHDAAVVRVHVDRHRSRLRAAALAHGGRHAKRGAAPSARHFGRDDELQQKLVRDHAHRGVRRHRFGRSAGRPIARQRLWRGKSGRGFRPIVRGGRREHVDYPHRDRHHGAEAAADRGRTRGAISDVSNTWAGRPARGCDRLKPPGVRRPQHRTVALHHCAR
jgi:hypothetical protein